MIGRSPRTRLFIALGVHLVSTIVATPAVAQDRTGFALNRYEPSERGSRWFVVDGLDLRGGARPALGVTLDYAHKPLVAYDSAQNERFAIVRHQLLSHLGGSLVMADRVRFGASVPVAIYQDGESAFVAGETLRAASAPALGDVRLAADARIAGHYGDPITLALGIRGWLPTGLRSQFTSDGSLRLSPQLLVAGELGIFAWAARAAIVYRTRDDTYAGSPLGSEIDGAAGAGVRIGRFLVGPELFASTRIDEGAFLRTHGTPADAIVGVHYIDPSGLRIAAALGSGLTHGYGSPALRGLLSIEWASPMASPPSDRDKDGIPDAADACPDWPGVPSDEPEQTGCPPAERIADEDADGDGIWDREDACPAVVGVRTSDSMTNGCPPGTPRQLAVVTKTEIRIGEQIQFATDSANLLGDSDAVLSAIQRVLDEHPEIRRVRVEGHTDDTGNPTYNDDLSRRRAASVVRWLVEQGIDPKRLVSEGFGNRKPIDTNLTEAGRSSNRRVAFTILERGTPP